MKKQKWYAYYESPGSWELASEAQMDKALKEERQIKPWVTKAEFTAQYFEYETLFRAKLFLKKHFRGDRDECRQGLKAIARIKAGAK